MGMCMCMGVGLGAGTGTGTGAGTGTGMGMDMVVWLAAHSSSVGRLYAAMAAARRTGNHRGNV